MLTRFLHTRLFCASLTSGLAAILLSVPVSAMDTTEAQALAEAYCAAALILDEAAAEALMTPGLLSVIAEARVVNLAFATANPGDKPPLGDGLGLTGYQDAAQSCTPIAIKEDGAVLEYVAMIDPSVVWLDRIEMERDASGVLAISDVVYAPDQMFRMTGVLAEVIAAQ